MVDKIKAAAKAEETQVERGVAFIAKAQQIHGALFNYDKVKYLRANTSVTITCGKHGDFNQRPANHLRGQGCPECAQKVKEQMGKDRRLTLEGFVVKSTKVHGATYDYSGVVYTSSDKPVDIKCSIHGKFTIARAEKHYLNAQGCPHCISLESSSAPERIIADELDKMGTLYHKEYTFNDCRSHISNHKLRFDFYLPDRNTLIEFHGEQHFKRNKMMHKGDKFERMQEHDRIKALYALERGITLVTYTTSNLADLRSCIQKLVN